MGRRSREQRVNRIDKRTAENRAGVAAITEENRRFKEDIRKLSETVHMLEAKIEHAEQEYATLAKAHLELGLDSDRIISAARTQTIVWFEHVQRSNVVIQAAHAAHTLRRQLNAAERWAKIELESFETPPSEMMTTISETTDA